MGAFKAINDSLLPEAFKPTTLKKSEDKDEVFGRWRDELVSAYEAYQESNDSESMPLVVKTLKILFDEGALTRNNRRTVRELQEKYSQLAMIMSHEKLLPEDLLHYLEDPLIKLHELYPDVPEIVLALVNVLVRQRKWLQAYHAAKYELNKQPFERNLIYFYLHSLFNMGLFSDLEREQAKYVKFVKYVPLRVPDPEEQFKSVEIILVLEKPTWNALLKSISDLITRHKSGPLWTTVISKIEFKMTESLSMEASGYNTPSQSMENIVTDAEEENSQQTLNKKRAASAQARKNLKKAKVVPKKYLGQYGFDLEAFLKKYSLFQPEIQTQLVLLQDRLQVPLIEMDSEFADQLEGKYLLDVVTLILRSIPESAWILHEFANFVQALLEKDAQDLITDQGMLSTICKIFKERRIEAGMEKLINLAIRRQVPSENQSDAMDVDSLVDIKADDPNVTLEKLMENMNAFNIQLLVDTFISGANDAISIDSNSKIAFLILLSKKLVLEKETQLKLLSQLFKGFVGRLELDESVYELALMLQKNEILTEELALLMAMKCPSGTYQWEILRALYKLGRVKNITDPPPALVPFTSMSSLDLRTAKAVVSYLEECWKSLDCSLDEVALLQAIEVVLEKVNVRGNDQMVLEANLGKMKRYFRVESRDVFDYTRNCVPPLLQVRSGEVLELRRSVIRIRIEVCEDAFSNRKRNIEWLKSFRKDLKYMLVSCDLGSEEFAEYWGKLKDIHYEIAHQLLSLDPFGIRGKENQARRNLKKYVMMSLLGHKDYDRMAEALFLMLHSLAQIEDIVFRRRALGYMTKIFMKAKCLSSKSKLLCGIAMVQSEHAMIGQEALLSWLNSQLEDLDGADYEFLYLASYFLGLLNCLPEKMLMERFGLDIETSVLNFIGPQFNVHKGKEELFPFFLKPKGLTFCGVHVPAMLPGFTNFCVQELTKELIDGEEEVEALLVVLNRLRVLEAQLPNPTELIVRCTQKLLEMALIDSSLIDSVLKEANNNKTIPEVSKMVEQLKVLKKRK